MSTHPDAIDAESRTLSTEIVPYATAPTAVPVPRYFQDKSPGEQVAYAVEVANALKPIIDAKGLAHKLNKKNPNDEYVELEAWQTCGKLCGMSAKVEWVKTIDKGYEARATVIRVDTGLEIGAGESRCTRDEYNWKTRDDYALSGMAQTRAQSRALRGQLAWILVLAGYKATPSEEMPTDAAPQAIAAPPKAKPAPASESAEQIESRRQKGIRDIAIFASNRGITDDRRHAIIAAVFEGKQSMKDLSLAELQALSKHLQAYVKDGMAEQPEVEFEAWLEFRLDQMNEAAHGW